MAVFISTSTDSFSETRKAQVYNMDTMAGVRRPIKGIELKKESIAYLRAIRSNGEPIFLLDGGQRNPESYIGYSPGTTSFLVQSVSETRVEKSQVVETFGEDFLFLFGERPKSITVQGILMNTRDFNWKSEFLENYDNFLRGTKLLENDARAYLSYDDVMVEGYLLTNSVQFDSESPTHANFTFEMFVTGYVFVDHVGTTRIPGYDTDIPPDNADEVLGRAPTYSDREEYIIPGVVDYPKQVENPPTSESVMSGEELYHEVYPELGEFGVDSSGPNVQAILMGIAAIHGDVRATSFGIQQAVGDIMVPPTPPPGWDFPPHPTGVILSPPELIII